MEAFYLPGVTYDLSHLHPQLIEVVQAAAGDKPAKIYHMQLIYSLHTFTRGVKEGRRQTKICSIVICESAAFSIFSVMRYPLGYLKLWPHYTCESATTLARAISL